MAMAMKCDRCRKFYEYYPKGNDIHHNGVQRIYRHKNGSLGSQETYDLCPECMNAFDEFMSKGKFVEAKHE